MLRQGRDSTRMREIGTLHRSLSMFQVDRPAVSIGDPNRIYISIPDTSDTCANLGLPTPPPNWSYRCVTAENLRNINGTGWIPINFTTMFQGSPLASLPVDPVNTVASGAFYVFVTDGRTWTLASLLESERYIPFAARDGGTDAARFEVGTNLSLWVAPLGTVSDWNLTINSSGATSVAITSGTGHGGTTNYTRTIAQGTVVALTAPATSGGQNFASWTGCDSVTTVTTCNLTMNAARTVTVSYIHPPYFIYITNTTHTGAFGGRAGADNICNLNANRPAVCTRGWAFISISDADEIRDFPATLEARVGRPFNPNALWRAQTGTHHGVVIASSWSDLLDNNIINTIGAGGADARFWWTFSRGDGSLSSPNNHCQSGTSNLITDIGVSGDSTRHDAWLDGSATHCAGAIRILCACF